MTYFKEKKIPVFSLFIALFLLLLLLSAGTSAASPESSVFSLKSAKIILEPSEFTYDGTAHIPAVTVTYQGNVLTEGRDYMLTFEDNTDAGKANVLITGTGNYTGKVKKQFPILKAENKLTADPVVLVANMENQEFSLRIFQKGDAKLSFKSDGDALTAGQSGLFTVRAGYAGISRVTVTAPATKNYKNASLTVQVTVCPPVPSLKSAENHIAGQMNLLWNSCPGANGYEIQFSADADFQESEMRRIDGKKSVSASLTDIPKEHSDWFVRIRSFCEKGKKTVCRSDWSEPVEAEVPLAVVLTGSDYQNNANSNAQKNFSGIMEEINAEGYYPDTVLMCGDYSDGSVNYGGEPSDSMHKIENAVRKAFPGFNIDRDLYFVEGNHDIWRDNGFYPADGLHDMGCWLMYVMNTYTSNPCQQGSGGERNRNIVQAAAAKMKADLADLTRQGETRPIVIATHVSLHFSDWTVNEGDNMYSEAFFDVLTDAAKSLTILYLFGHNHGGWGDNSIGGARIFLCPGDEILIPDPLESERKNTGIYRRETLNFYYMTAGYVGYTSDSPANTHESVGILLVYEDRLALLRCGFRDDGSTGKVSLGLAGNRTSLNWPIDYLSKETEDYVLGL